MKISVAILSVAMALGAVSCGGNSSQPQTSDNNRMQPPGVAISGHPSQNGGVAAGSHIDGDAPPKDAQFTLFCDAIGGPNHVMAATAIKDQLIAKTQLRGWHILHTNDQSTIFFGYYRTFNDKEHDPAETARAQADLHKIEALTNAQGDRFFKKAIFLPINDADPDAEAKWNLANTPSTAYWSLQIAAFRGFPERKAAAIAAVREARKSGIEAYYYHGETISSVCVGAWPEEAVKKQEMKSGRSLDPNETLLIPTGPLPPNTSPELTIHGERVRIEAPKLEVLDGTLAQAIRDFPEHAVNYEVTVKTAPNGEKIPSPSFLVLIPHSDAAPAPLSPLLPANVSADTGANQAARDILDNPVQPGRGQLKSIDQP